MPNFISRRLRQWLLFGLAILVANSVYADNIQMIFTGTIAVQPPKVNTATTFEMVVTYADDIVNLQPESAPNFAKYSPVLMTITVDGETISNSDVRVNIDVWESFELIGFADDNFQGNPDQEIPPDPPTTEWTGTLFGGAVEYVGSAFGRGYNDGLTLDLPTSINLEDWEYYPLVIHYPNEGIMVNLDIVEVSNDEDGDGVVGGADTCPGSLTDAIVNELGCSIAQICPCNGFKNHGGVVSCSSRTAEDFVQTGLISDADKTELVSHVAKSSCGKI